MGWRTTAQNFNLNRDYMKADAPEMQAMLALVEAWDPLAVVDLHVTDGAQFEHDVAIQVEPGHAGDAALRVEGRALRDAVIADLAKQGSLPLPWYPSFNTYDDPTSGVTDGVAPPRFSTGYSWLRNRFAMLVETHSWKDYPTREAITHDTVLSVLRQVAAHGAQWRQLELAADERARALAGQSVPLEYEATDKSHLIDFKGYAYTRTPSEVSGALMTRYDETKPQIWRVPLKDDVRPEITATMPKAGYVVPAAYATAVSEKLSLHGIAFRTIAASLLRAPAEAFRATKVTFSAGSSEGRHTVKFEGQWAPEPREIVAGSLFVPSAQAKARLVAALLEPQAPDSLAQWGWFNTAFEKKEYMEDYVAEEIARQMLAADPALAAAFKRKLESDPEFAKDKAQRLEFFYRRHASWDERYNLYPVLRLDTEPR
jgi:hypothetical protein